MTLHTKILDAARDEVAKKQGFPSWDEMWNFTAESANKISSGQLIEGYGKEAALLAMEKQAEFFRKISRKKWGMLASGEWWNRAKQRGATELELYEIWEREPK